MMIGDDIVNDVGGAQACGLRGVQVRTGKYRYIHTTLNLVMSVVVLKWDLWSVYIT